MTMTKIEDERQYVVSFYRRVRRARMCHRRQTNDDDVPYGDSKPVNSRGKRWIIWMEDVHGIAGIDSFVWVQTLKQGRADQERDILHP
mmetsp:Transcript_21181/g.22606  ORF Transcript_21181/g.22606 Transcript_21181/m.22606 type:complete len:88 (-) Transcript_21181:374-637(-)